MPRFWYIGEAMAQKLAEAPRKKKKNKILASPVA